MPILAYVVFGSIGLIAFLAFFGKRCKNAVLIYIAKMLGAIMTGFVAALTIIDALPSIWIQFFWGIIILLFSINIAIKETICFAKRPKEYVDDFIKNKSS